MSRLHPAEIAISSKHAPMKCQNFVSELCASMACVRRKQRSGLLIYEIHELYLCLLVKTFGSRLQNMWLWQGLAACRRLPVLIPTLLYLDFCLPFSLHI